MPVSPSVLADPVHAHPANTSEKIINFIDTRLKKGKPSLEMYQCGDGYRFTLPGIITEQEALEITRQYKQAGWSRVEVHNASLGHRPRGLVKTLLVP